ncbi:zinc finger protein 700-like [Pectinophora gossypiella]|uniref:Protein krueppel n=1 Tax=Pectinophora gossypiella TaxID=13191 RepID=A0A1E1WA41_PECGO|nr:zinc finger protein 700-like [Pectinophora gossypiella]
MSFKDRCRTCLGKSNEMRHVHASIIISEQEIRLSDILYNFYSYQVSQEPDYPENICINCVHQLTLTHAFKTLIETSANTLAGNTPIETNSDNNDCPADYEMEYKPDTDSKIDIQYDTLQPSPIETYQPKSLPKSYKLKPIVPVKRDRRRMIIKRVSNIERQLYCVECKAEFNCNKSLMDHCTDNHPVRSTTGRDCQYCEEKFEDFKELVIHRKLHLKPYLCMTCWSGFYTENEYTTHKCQPNQNRRRKDTEKVLQQCDQCGKSYPPGYIKVHMMTHGNELKYSCKYCPKKFKVANGLNSHILWNHKRTRDHKCDVCGATFISASARSTHIRKNHLKEKKYGCESCAKRFFSKSELQRHMLTHTGVKNFHCHLCDKSYQTRYGLNVHLKSHAHLSINVLGL